LELEKISKCREEFVLRCGSVLGRWADVIFVRSEAVVLEVEQVPVCFAPTDSIDRHGPCPAARKVCTILANHYRILDELCMAVE
jgi:hypothetical protein